MRKGGELEGWKVEKLKSITTKIGSGATPLGGEKAYKSEGVSLIRSLNVHDMGFRMKDLAFLDDKQSDKLSNVTVESGDVLLNITGASVARCCIVPDDVLPARVNQHVSIIRLVKDEMSPEFLHYALISNEYKDSLLKTGEKGGSTRQAITKAQIEDFSIKYPPLPEQQRIVSVLDEAFASIAQAKSNAERNLVNARELFESMLESFFEDPQHTPDGKELASLCELIVDCEHKTAPIQDEGYPSIRTPNIGRGYLILEGVNRVSEETYTRWTRRAIPQGGDLILAREAPAGNVAVIPDGLEVCLGQRTVLIRPNNKIFNSQYLMWLLLSDNVQKFFLQNSKGSTVVHVNMKDIRGLKINNIPPLAEQRAIVGRLEALSAETGRLEEIYQQKLESLEELKKSVLGKAFEGEL